MGKRWKVLVPGSLYSQDVVDLYEGGGDVEVHFALPPEERVLGGGPLGPEGQRKKAKQVVWDRIAEFDVVGAMYGEPFITAELLDRNPNLWVVFIGSAGFDSIDVDAATSRGVAVINAAGNNVVPVSEHAIGLLLAVSRKITQMDRLTRSEGRGLHVAEVGTFPPVMADRTLGIVGLGAIGKRVCCIASAGLGMKVVVFDPFVDATAVADLDIELVDSLDELLTRSDAVSMHLPLTEATRHTIGRRELALMKPGSFLVNTSRGGTVDTDALVEALESGHLGGAGIDVTDPEPLPAGHRLLTLDNVVLTPHIAGASPDIGVIAHSIVARSVMAALRGEPPPTLVNKDVWDRFRQRWEREAA